MKRAIRIVLWSLFGFISAVYIILFIAYNSYKPDEISIEPSEDKLAYFNETYDECRADFIDAVSGIEDQYRGVEYSRIKVPSSVDQDLYIDLAYVPAQDTTISLLILSSGLHGVEGYTGSAIQLMTIREILAPEKLANTGLIFIHGINPYGFKYIRKVSENNVDLNRNCAIDRSLFSQVNEGYRELENMLGPKKEADHANSRNRNFHLIAVQKIIAESMGALRQAALQGQYEYPKGIYYGGQGYEPQIIDLAAYLAGKMEDYSIVLNVDLHTGYGANGVIHLFLNPIQDQEVKKGLEDVFSGYQIDWGNSDDYYTILGSFYDWIGSLADVDLYLPMMFEYGTLDSQKTLGSIKSIQNMILENQGYHYGFKNDKSEKVIKKRFREMYYPSSEKWRTKVIEDSRVILEQVFDNLDSL
jgi:hypothetical protein